MSWGGPTPTLRIRKGRLDDELYVHPGVYFCPSFIIFTFDKEIPDSIVSKFFSVDKSITVIKGFLVEVLQPSRNSDKTQNPTG